LTNRGVIPGEEKRKLNQSQLKNVVSRGKGKKKIQVKRKWNMGEYSGDGSA